MRRSPVNAREAGFALIGKVNRWLIAGAVALTVLISVAAARSFKGHSTPRATTHRTSSTSSSSTTSSPSSSGSGLQQPSTTPSVSPQQSQPSPAVSGGS